MYVSKVRKDMEKMDFKIDKRAGISLSISVIIIATLLLFFSYGLPGGCGGDDKKSIAYFVDPVNGSDDNDGTEEKPLKTEDEAVERFIRYDKEGEIYVRENNSFKALSSIGTTKLYVSPMGDDNNPGTQKKPFATIKKAKEYIKINGLKGATVLIGGGKYYLNETLIFGDDDSGSANKTTTYRNYPRENPILRGSKKIEDFTLDSGNKYKADLAGLGVNSQIKQFFITGKRQVLARVPNFDPNHKAGGDFLYPDETYKAYCGEPDTKSISFKYKDKYLEKNEEKTLNPETWTNINEIDVVAYDHCNWRGEVIKIKDIDPDTNTVNLTQSTLYGGFYPGARFFIQNVHEELDDTGEWYHNLAENTLYFIPEKAPGADDDLTIPAIENVILVDSAKYLNFTGLSIEESTGTIFEIKNSKNIKVDSCKIKNSGYFGIHIAAGQNITISNCEVFETGYHGISAETTVTLWRKQAPNFYTIKGNYVHDTAALFFGGGIGISIFAVNGSISNNHVTNTPGIGINFSGNDIVVERNYIHDVNTRHQDSGAIYTYNPDSWLKRGNIVRNNYVENSGGYGWDSQIEKFVTPYYTFGIYNDGLSSGTKIYGNTIKGAARAAITFNARDTIVYKNKIINSINLEQLGIHDALSVDTIENILPKMADELYYLNKMILFEGGVSGKSANFTENSKYANSYIEISDNNSLDLTDKFSISLFFKLNKAISERFPLINKYGAYILDLLPADSTHPKDYVVAYTWKGNNIWTDWHAFESVLPLKLNLNEWYHIAWTNDGMNERVFFNGLKINEINKSFSGTITNGTNLYFGARVEVNDAVPINYFKSGGIDEVLIYSKTLTPDEVLSIYKKEKPVLGDLTLAGYWNFDNQTLNDSSLKKNHGIHNPLNKEAFIAKYPEIKNYPEFKTQNYAVNPKDFSFGNSVRENTIIYHPAKDTHLYQASDNFLNKKSKFLKNIFWHGLKEKSVTVHKTPGGYQLTLDEWQALGYDTDSTDLDNIEKPYAISDEFGLFNDPEDDIYTIVNKEKVTKSFPLLSKYCDLNGKTVNDKLTLKTFESAILFSCYCNNDLVCNNNEDKLSCPNDCNPKSCENGGISPCFDKTLEIDGTKNYIEIPNNELINFGKDDSFTVEFWLNTEQKEDFCAICDEGIILQKWNGSLYQYPFSIRMVFPSGKIKFYMYGGEGTGNSLASIRGINDGAWHHVAVTREANNSRKIFIDGKIEINAGDFEYKTDISNDNPILVGVFGASYAKVPFIGNLYDLRISNKPIYNGDFTPSPNLKALDSTIGLWKISDKDGNKIPDSSGNEIHGTYHVIPP